jgi:flagellar hook-basal body complex protein FliE
MRWWRYQFDHATPLMRTSIVNIDSLTKASGLAKVAGTASSSALLEVSKNQKTSGALTKAFTLENSTVSLEEVMLAGVKSGIGFQAAVQTRNRVMQAYTDVMNMQI